MGQQSLQVVHKMPHSVCNASWGQQQHTLLVLALSLRSLVSHINISLVVYFSLSLASSILGIRRLEFCHRGHEECVVTKCDAWQLLSNLLFVEIFPKRPCFIRRSSTVRHLCCWWICSSVDYINPWTFLTPPTYAFMYVFLTCMLRCDEKLTFFLECVAFSVSFSQTQVKMLPKKSLRGCRYFNTVARTPVVS